jgi:hypothetical protein
MLAESYYGVYSLSWDEYRVERRAAMSMHVLGDAAVIAIRPQAPGRVPVADNPLEPATGPDGARFPLQSHASLVRALFLAVFDTRAPFPQILSAGILRSYERAGWNLITDKPAGAGTHAVYPTLEDLEAAVLSVVDDAGYGREDGDLRSLVRERIHAIAPDSQDDREGIFHAGVLLIQVIEHLRLRQARRGTRPGPVRPAAETFTRLLDEIRAYGADE